MQEFSYHFSTSFNSNPNFQPSKFPVDIFSSILQNHANDYHYRVNTMTATMQLNIIQTKPIGVISSPNINSNTLINNKSLNTPGTLYNATSQNLLLHENEHLPYPSWSLSSTNTPCFDGEHYIDGKFYQQSRSIHAHEPSTTKLLAGYKLDGSCSNLQNSHQWGADFDNDTTPNGFSTNCHGENEAWTGCIHAGSLVSAPASNPSTSKHLGGVPILPPAATRSATLDSVIHNYTADEPHVCTPISSNCYFLEPTTIGKPRRGGNYGGRDACNQSRISSTGQVRIFLLKKQSKKRIRINYPLNLHKYSLRIHLTLNPTLGRYALVLNHLLRDMTDSVPTITF